MCFIVTQVRSQRFRPMHELRLTLGTPRRDVPIYWVKSKIHCLPGVLLREKAMINKTVGLKPERHDVMVIADNVERSQRDEFIHYSHMPSLTNPAQCVILYPLFQKLSRFSPKQRNPTK